MEALGDVQCYFVAWGEGKQEVLLKCYIVLIAVMDVVAACDNSSNIEVTLYSGNCGGQGENKFVVASYLHVVTKVQMHSVTHKYIPVGRTHTHIHTTPSSTHAHKDGKICYNLVEKNIKISLNSGPVLFHRSMLQLLELQGRRERHSKFTIATYRIQYCKFQFGC